LYRLGFDPILEVSAEHGQGVGELLDEIVKRLPRAVRPQTQDIDAGDSQSHASNGHDVARGSEIAVAIVGRPNSGKSSLVNRLLREERMIVSEVPGTTRDAVDSTLKWHRRQFRIVDTAGIRRPGRVAKGGQVEEVSVLLARRAIERADVVILVIDSPAGATDQDAAIAGAADKAGRGVIIAANKWDLMKSQGPDAYKTFDDQVRQQLKFLDYAPIAHVSAKSGERTTKLLELVDAVAAARRIRVPTPALNRFVDVVTSQHPPVSPGHRNVRVLYTAQTGVSPPTFVMFTNVATKFHFSYERFLENRLRDTYGFIGTPIRLTVRKRSRGRSIDQKHRGSA
jgi:GTP-binding protein